MKDRTFFYYILLWHHYAHHPNFTLPYSSQNVYFTVANAHQGYFFMVVTAVFRVQYIHHICHIHSHPLPLIYISFGGIYAVFGFMVQCLACSDA